MSDKVAIITGAGGGIGRACAISLARAGFAVVLAGRTQTTLEGAARRIEEAGGQARCVVSDITDPASVSALFDTAATAYGRVDLLFNNAGVTIPSASIEDITLDAWRTIMEANVTGAFLCTQAAFRIMKTQSPQGGRIINNASVAAQSPRPHSAAYAITKSAITGLTKSAALDGRKYGIACCQIDIGNAATDMTDGFGAGMLQADGTVRPEPTFDVRHVGDLVAHVASLPLEANVPFVTLMATAMPLLGRG